MRFSVCSPSLNPVGRVRVSFRYVIHPKRTQEISGYVDTFKNALLVAVVMAIPFERNLSTIFIQARSTLLNKYNKM